MAESVQSVMDAMVPPLRDLLDRGIFTESEIRSVASRRRRYEYLLRRRCARKSDYLRYAEDEAKLERLRRLRTRRIRERAEEGRNKSRHGGGGGGAGGKKLARGIGDNSIVQHIHFIFVRALRKWREDVSLHLAHAEFARRVGSTKRIGRIYAEALQVHPRNVPLWIEAASHEYFGPAGSPHRPADFDDDDVDDGYGARRPGRRGRGEEPIGGGSVRSARVLLQRGLRFNPRSSELWVGHFRLELDHARKLGGAREVADPGGMGDDTDTDTDDDDLDDRAGGASAVSDRLPLVVYRNAVKSMPDDVSLRLRFVDACRDFSPDADGIAAEILGDIDRDFGGSVDAWIARARYAREGLVGRSSDGAAGGSLSAAAGGDDGDGSDSGGDDDDDDDDDGGDVRTRKRKRDDLTDRGGGDGHGHGDASDPSDPVRRVLDDATERLGTAEMYASAVRFVWDRMGRAGNGAEVGGTSERGDDDDDGDGGDVAFLGRLLSKARDSGVRSPDLALVTAEYMLGTGDAAGAEGALGDAATGDGDGDGGGGFAMGDARVWIRWSQVAGRMADTGSPPARLGPEAILRTALERVPVRDGGHVRVGAELLRRLLLRPPGGGGRGRSRSARDGGGEAEATALLKRLLLLSDRPGGSRGGGGEPPGGEDVIVDLPGLCLAHLRASSARGLEAARAAYGTVLFDSGYARSCGGMSPREVRTMGEYLEACLCLEGAAAAAAVAASTERGGWSEEARDGRRRLARVYDAAVGFYREGGDARTANAWKVRRGTDRLLR